MLKVDSMCCWLWNSRHKNPSFQQISHKISILFIPTRRLSNIIQQENGDTLKPFMEYLNVTFSGMTGVQQCTLTLTTSVKMAGEPAYRDIVSSSDCTSILPVMRFCEMARKKTPNKRRRGKEKKERLIRHPCYFLAIVILSGLKERTKSQSFITSKKTIFLVSFNAD